MQRILTQLVAILVVFGLLVGCAAPAVPAGPAAPADQATTVPGEETTATGERPQMTFWMNLNFEEKVNELVREQVSTWAEENNVDIEILISADTDLSARWSAGLEAPDTLPDVSVVFAQWFPRLYDAGLLLDVSDAYAEANSHAGGFFPAAGQSVTVDGSQYAVPYIGSVTPAYWRTDKLAEAGLSEPPDNYADFLEYCRLVNEPGTFWCYGLALGGFSDNEVELRNLIWSFGGTVVGEDGKTVTINSPETIAAMEWLLEMWEIGSLPPDTVVGDDASNNRWYQTGLAAVVVNTGSILSWLRQNDEDLLANTMLTPSPGGPAGRHAAGGFGAVLGAFNTTQYPELANSLIAHFAHPDQVWARSEAVNFGNLPVHVEAADDPVWDDPFLRPFIEQLQFVHPTPWPGPSSVAAYEVQNQLVLSRMAIRIITGEQSIEESLAQAEAEIIKIYEDFPPPF